MGEERCVFKNLTFGKAFDLICEYPEQYYMVNNTNPRNMHREIYIQLPSIVENISTPKVMCNFYVNCKDGSVTMNTSYLPSQEDLLSHKWEIYC